MNGLANWQRIGVAIFGVAALGSYFYLSLQQYRASAWARSSQQPQGLQRAISIEPSVAQYQNALGRYLQFADQDPAVALAHYRAAVSLNPYSGQYWLDLAAMWEVMGEREQQEAALDRALVAEPSTPEIVWGVANFHLLRGEIDVALPLLRRVTEARSRIDGRVDVAAIDVCWRATHDVDLLTERLLPATSTFRLALVQFLLEQHQWDAARRAWSRLIELREPFDIGGGLNYINALIQQNAIETAADAWVNMADINPGFRAYRPSENLVVNGGFEEELLGSGFDWRLYPRPNTAFGVDTGQFHGGNRSLRIDFKGDQGSDTGLVQIVPVKPDTRYEFSGFMRAEDLWSSSGPRFQISGEKGEQYFLSEDVIGSTLWRECEKQFITGAETRSLAIAVIRTPGNSRIKGTVWIDDVSLRERP